jgi:hypothetical protein
LRLNIVTSSGAITGSVVHPFTGKKIQLRGAVLQKQGVAYGYFLGTNESGSVTLESQVDP